MNDDFWANGSKKPHLDLPAFMDSSVTDGICELLSLGVLVSLGLTRDGGAIGVGVFNNGRRRREYFRASEDAGEWMRHAADSLRAAGVSHPAGDPESRQMPTRGAYKPF